MPYVDNQAEIQLEILPQIEKLDRAIASGVLTVDSHTQGRITYRNMSEMMAARAFLQAKLGSLQNLIPTRRIVVTGRTGF